MHEDSNLEGNNTFSKDFFLIKPFNDISTLVIEKKSTINLFETILEVLFNYFKDKKEYRTISDVDRVIKQIEDVLWNKEIELESLNDEEKERQSHIIVKDSEEFINKYSKEIEKAFLDSNLEPFIMHWILNLDTSMKIFIESFEFFEIKKHKLERMSKRGFQKLFDRFVELVKAIFLVLYRITEQFYMIINKISFSLEDELSYLLNDIVYLENVQRIVNRSFR